MSYNISRWELRKLENFSVNFHFNDEFEIVWGPNDTVQINFSEDGAIYGVVQDGRLHISQIQIRGEGSGWAYHYFLEDLKTSLQPVRGLLDVVMIWEGGDSINRLVVLNDTIREEPIDIVALLDEIEKLKASTL